MVLCAGDLDVIERGTVPCQECGVELAGDSPDLRLELTCDGEPIVYCSQCWDRSSAAKVASALLWPDRATRLREQAEAWQLALARRTYCDDSSACTETSQRQPNRWRGPGSHIARLDRLTNPPVMPQPPEITPNALRGLSRVVRTRARARSSRAARTAVALGRAGARDPGRAGWIALPEPGSLQALGDFLSPGRPKAVS
jgi:hypothetical protein